jgi:hypothetical protein
MPADLAATLRAERQRQREAQMALSEWPNTGLVVVDEAGPAAAP